MVHALLGGIVKPKEFAVEIMLEELVPYVDAKVSKSLMKPSWPTRRNATPPTNIPIVAGHAASRRETTS